MKNKNEIVTLHPRLNAAGRFVYRLLSQLPEQPLSRGDHMFEHAVGRAVLNGDISAEEGYQQMELFEADQHPNRWDSEGTYFDGTTEPPAAA